MFLRELILENKNEEKTYKVIFGGRFQPPTPGHLSVYNWLIKNFDKDNVYIATSDKTDKDKIENYKKIKQRYLNLHNKWREGKLKTPPKEPVLPEIKSLFNFDEKKYLWTRLFGIPENKIILSKSPAFNPIEILEKYPDETVYITITSEKDKNRFTNSNYFEPYPMIGNKPAEFNKVKDKLKGYKEKGYYIVLPELQGISATKVRNMFLSNISEEEKKKNFYKIYGKFDENIFEMIKNKLDVIKEIE